MYSNFTVFLPTLRTRKTSVTESRGGRLLAARRGGGPSPRQVVDFLPQAVKPTSFSDGFSVGRWVGLDFQFQLPGGELGPEWVGSALPKAFQ
jgi:hypothetical protein